MSCKRLPQAGSPTNIWGFAKSWEDDQGFWWSKPQILGRSHVLWSASGGWPFENAHCLFKTPLWGVIKGQYPSGLDSLLNGVKMSKIPKLVGLIQKGRVGYRTRLRPSPLSKIIFPIHPASAGRDFPKGTLFNPTSAK